MAVALNDLSLALRRKTGFETLDTEDKSETHQRFIGRIPAHPADLNINNWKIVIYRLLATAGEGRPWVVDISRWYFIRPETKKLVYAWRLKFQSKKGPIVEHFADIVNIVNTSPQTSRAEVTEVMLPGNVNRNDTTGGRRGAGPMGSVMTGPVAVQKRLMGG